MAERIDMWRATDGKIMATEYEADLHNNYLEVHEAISADFDFDRCESTTDFLGFVMEHRGQIEKLFSMQTKK
jgi:hypothetical protein